VQLDDALGRVEQQNLPGTIDEHPNWRRRYAVAVDALAAHAGLTAIAAIFSPPESPTPSPRETRPWQ
jgi:4-alpha-glucanotransferase